LSPLYFFEYLLIKLIVADPRGVTFKLPETLAGIDFARVFAFWWSVLWSVDGYG